MSGMEIVPDFNIYVRQTLKIIQATRRNFYYNVCLQLFYWAMQINNSSVFDKQSYAKCPKLDQIVLTFLKLITYLIRGTILFYGHLSAQCACYALGLAQPAKAALTVQTAPQRWEQHIITENWLISLFNYNGFVVILLLNQ